MNNNKKNNKKLPKSKKLDFIITIYRIEKLNFLISIYFY